jgi:hypothetical protein
LAAVDAQDASLGWKKRLTWVTTPPSSVRIGTIIAGERLALRVGCPRCKHPSVATIWRRFDYFGREHPVYFTKCRRCRRRTAVDSVEVALLLLDAGVASPLELVPDTTHSMWGENPSTEDNDIVSVPSAEKLLLNYQRAFGKKHLLTFMARSILADAVGGTGDASEAVRMYEQLLVDQQSELRADHPAVLANRYRAAMWAARDGHPSPALVALENLLVDQERASSPDHPNTLVIRASIAELLAVTGEREEAIAILRQVRADQLRVLGSEHPSTESTRKALAELEDE